ncbi:putative Calcium-binding EF-hand family protein [Tripterygium wilfordii]|uniref:Putative Calcium-binding EF-hand family protein n=1 Tax=Tripterygium wilfordii TaxID=458696 RepID=A0A7J7CVT7_TRIWF|nr:calmodulin-like protein 30 [Tripterygium wilfordii]KAF5738210.1 putative Calcium-binding EF-hand family protein [Tripterygium wilfordii]
MSKQHLSFLKFHGLSRKSSLKPTKPITNMEPQISNAVPSPNYQPNMEEMKWVFNKYDTNKDGKISRGEYKSAMRFMSKEMNQAEMAKAFGAVDTDGDGFIDFKEFMEMMHYNMGEAEGVKSNEIQSAFQVFDLDGNGRIGAEELMEVLRKMGEKSSLEACQKMIKGVDRDGDGLIDMDEFSNMMTRTMKLS